MTLALRYAVRSDQGLVRGNNEDSVYAGPRLLAIADGMGGHAGGEIASKMVIGEVEYLDEDRPVDDLITTLRDAVRSANHTLAAAVAGHPELQGMGTTLTALRFAGAKVGLVHVGDSRAYMLRNGALNQITHDDTYVQSLVDAGRLTAEEANHHPRKSVILRALNGADVEPDVSIREARRGDRYLLCSDGLTDVVRADTILDEMSVGDPQDCADRLVALALRGGGPDNVTVVVADVVDAAEGDDLPVVAGAVVDPGVDSNRVDDDGSPARRAALLSRVLSPTRVVGRASRAGWRSWAIPLLIAVVLVSATIGTYIWTQRQYFVGRKGSSVAVFRGVNTSFGPIHMFRVVERSSLAFTDLNQAARDQVAGGITADDRRDADNIIERLRGRLLPLCNTEPSQPPSSSSSSSSSRGTTSTRKTTPRKRTTPTKTTARRTVPPSSSAVPSPSPSSTPQQPGVDCRLP
jgi:PPM family protein phosphatase